MQQPKEPAKSKKNAPTNVGKQRKSRALLISFCFVGVLAIAFVAWWIIIGGKMSAQNDMANYLNKKYGREFVVERPERKASGLGVEGYLQAGAYPKGDESLRFTVQRASTFISDGYPGAVWRKEELSRIEPIVQATFGKTATLELEIISHGTLRGDIDIKGDIPAFEDAQKTYGHKILYNLHIQSSTMTTDENRNQISSIIYDFIKNINTLSDTSFSYSTTIEPGREYGVVLSNDDIANLKDADGINEYYKEWRVK